MNELIASTSVVDVVRLLAGADMEEEEEEDEEEEDLVGAAEG